MRVRDLAVCRDCHTHDCIRGVRGGADARHAGQRGCELGLFLPAKVGNLDCTLCLDKCPGQAVTFHPTTREPLICDMCDGDPACVKVCPSGTIMFKGVKMAAIQPEQIAAGLSVPYRARRKPDEEIAPPALMRVNV